MLDWLRAPSMVLVPFLQSSANHSPELKAFLARLADDGNPLATRDDESADARRVRACSRRLKWGQRAKALRTLLSPGVANEHPRAEAIMRDMHPSPRRQITPPADLGPGLQATTGHVAKALDALLSPDHTAMDFSGWSANLLLPVRGRPDIMHPIIDLLRAITNCEMPLEVYWLITVGSLVAIHKLDEDAQAARAALFLDPKLRPITMSSLLWKCSTEVAINHKEYAAAIVLLQPALPCVDVSVSGSDLSSSHPHPDLSCGPGIPNVATIADVSALPLQSIHVPPSSSQLGPARDGVGELGDVLGAAAGGLPRLSRGNCSVDGSLQFSYVDGTPQSQASPGRGEAAPDLSSPAVLLHGLQFSNSSPELSSRGGGSLQAMRPVSACAPRPASCLLPADAPAAGALHGPQLGLGAKLGMHRMALTAQEFFADGYSVSEMDGANAFNSASRQAMLMAVLRECPHMARLFWMGYCSHSPLVLMRLAGSFAVLLSQEGARMGDKFGSFVPPLMTSRALPGTLLTCVVCSWLPLRSSSATPEFA